MKEQGVEKKGALLVPGLYEFKDFLQELSQKKATYSFKSSGRTRAPTGYQVYTDAMKANIILLHYNGS